MLSIYRKFDLFIENIINDIGIIEALAAFNTTLRYRDTPLILYQPARIYDWHKREPEKALEFYRQYLAREDSSHLSIWEFVQNRVTELKR